jgi:hypothetical protein
MENFLYLGVGFFIIDAVIIMINGLRASVQFGRYLEDKYPKQYHTLAYENYLRKALRIPWDKNSIAYFVWFSTDDFGDPRIAIFKKKIKWSFYGFLINGITMMIFFATVALLLERSTK